MPSGLHLISWTAYQTAYIAQLTDKRNRSLLHKWYLDIKANTTLPDSHDHLYDHYVCSPSTTFAIDLVPASKYTAVIPSCTFKISLLKSLILPTNLVSYYRRLNISPDFSSLSSTVDGDSIEPSPLCNCLPSPIVHDTRYLNSIATYTHGTIQNWPSSTRAEAAAIYAALRISPDDSTISIYTDS
ncbi:hypothetical protein GLOIN_2v1783661 [Rhizophagus clarus]|uniref:RNase H type-1 domain-containing protein n=1 Tax=Rhizophagus clarus TaxID=94130 RepID=A0A8H3LQF6_9GLOM|nr:hypothetical protein GLOIN_2v1783661 [Rhizophagus clarus]